jgi:pimeloyl-ACP methyl ester carboxylesterase
VEKYKQPEWDNLMLSFDLEARLKSVIRRGFYNQDLLTDEELEGYIEPFRGDDGKKAYLRCARAVSNLDTLAIAPHLKNINVETLILWGEHDQFLGVKNGRRLESDIRVSRLVLVPETRHFCPDEKGAEIAQLILNFVK